MTMRTPGTACRRSAIGSVCSVCSCVQFNTDFGALPGLGVHLNAGSDALGALTHDLQAHVGFVQCPGCRIKTQSIVTHQEHPLGFAVNLHLHQRGLCMLAHIG